MQKTSLFRKQHKFQRPLLKHTLTLNSTSEQDNAEIIWKFNPSNYEMFRHTKEPTTSVWLDFLQNPVPAQIAKWSDNYAELVIKVPHIHTGTNYFYVYNLPEVYDPTLANQVFNISYSPTLQHNTKSYGKGFEGESITTYEENGTTTRYDARGAAVYGTTETALNVFKLVAGLNVTTQNIITVRMYNTNEEGYITRIINKHENGLDINFEIFQNGTYTVLETQSITGNYDNTSLFINIDVDNENKTIELSDGNQTLATITSTDNTFTSFQKFIILSCPTMCIHDFHVDTATAQYVITE